VRHFPNSPSEHLDAVADRALPSGDPSLLAEYSCARWRISGRRWSSNSAEPPCPDLVIMAVGCRASVHVGYIDALSNLLRLRHASCSPFRAALGRVPKHFGLIQVNESDGGQSKGSAANRMRVHPVGTVLTKRKMSPHVRNYRELAGCDPGAFSTAEESARQCP
jgi:hypothetical protein